MRRGQNRRQRARLSLACYLSLFFLLTAALDWGSHAQALGQCRQYIADHYPHAQTVATSSTAEAAALVADDAFGSSLAIGSPSCISYFPRLFVLQSNIQDAGKGLLLLHSLTLSCSHYSCFSFFFVDRKRHHFHRPQDYRLMQPLTDYLTLIFQHTIPLQNFSPNLLR